VIDVESLLLAEVKKNSEQLNCLQKEIHEMKIDVLSRVHEQDKRILSQEFKSGFYGTIGGALSLVGLKLFELWTRTKT
jgi:hypothetical protein